MCKMDIFGEEVKLDGHLGMYRACNYWVYLWFTALKWKRCIRWKFVNIFKSFIQC